MTDADHIAAVQQRIHDLGMGTAPPRVGAERGRIWVATSTHEKAFGATFAEACAAWLGAHPVVEVSGV